MLAMLFVLGGLMVYFTVAELAERFVPERVWVKLFRVFDFD